MTKVSDEQLLRRFNEGDGAAFEVLLARYRTQIYSFVLRSVRDGDRALDLTQDVFLKVIKRSGQFQERAKFSTWLYTIARNVCIDHGRRMSFRRHQSLDTSGRDDEGSPWVERVPSDAAGTHRAAAQAELQQKLADSVADLPDDQREVFLMRQVQGLSFREIAQVVDIPENTAKSRMRYALERLQAALSEYEGYLRELRTS